MSVKQAASTLFVTQATVSQQIRLLEEALGLRLFERHHRSLSLTAAGEQLLPYAKVAFESLDRGVAKLLKDDDPNSIAITVLPSFASKWLIPRLGDFYKRYPHIALKLVMTEALESFSGSSLDLAIRFGNGNYKGLMGKHFLAEYVYPVCHPNYLQTVEINDINDLRDQQVLDDVEDNLAWDNWLQQNKLDKTLFAGRIRFDGSHYVIDAALAAQGVAMVRHSLAAEFIAQGNLVRLFGAPVALDQAFYLCAPAYHFQRQKVKYFVDWIQLQAAEFKQQYSPF